MRTGPAQEDTVERDENRASSGRQRREMSTGPAQEDTVERDERRASTGRQWRDEHRAST